MIVVGIDPGYESLGYAFLKIDRKKREPFHVMDFGEIRTKSSIPFAERLSILDDDLRQLLNLYCPLSQEKKSSAEKNCAAVERLLFAQNTTSALKVSEARGIVLLSLYRYGFLIKEYYPSQMKKMIASNGRANKERIMQILPHFTDLKTAPKADNAADALALAVSCAFGLDFPKNAEE